MNINIHLEEGQPAKTAQVVISETIERPVFTGSIDQLKAKIAGYDDQIAAIEAQKQELIILLGSVEAKFVEKGVTDVEKVVPFTKVAVEEVLVDTPLEVVPEEVPADTPLEVVPEEVPVDTPLEVVSETPIVE